MDCLTSEQLAEWEAYDRLEPIGGFRQDYRFAQVCHLIFELAQSIYGKKDKRTRSHPTDFMPWGPMEKPKAKKQTAEEIKTALTAIFKQRTKKKVP